MIYSITSEYNTTLPDRTPLLYVDHRIFNLTLIRGVSTNNKLESGLFGHIIADGSCSLWLISIPGLSQEHANNPDHHHISALDNDFTSYKRALDTNAFSIYLTDPSREYLMRSRFPNWEYKGVSTLGEPIFKREY